MTEQDYVTRCPHCDTSFRVNDAQLAAAGGAVRCGACLLVFTATEHFVTHQQFSEVDDDELVDAVDAIEPGEALDESDAFEDEVGGEDDAGEEDDVEIEAAFDWKIGPEVSPDSPVVMSFGSLIADPAEVPGAKWGETDEQDEEDFEPPLDLESLDDEIESLSADDEDHFVVETDPDELIVTQAGPWRPRLRWWFASAALILLAGAQFAWFERDRYALDPEYRDAYLAVCRWLPCDLPAYSEPEALGVSGLVIRSHPRRDNALKVDALLKNDARYRQAFPSLRLQFSDLQNNEVAARIFRPQEYLAGEMAGLHFIPGNTEVRVSIEIIDPGPTALNYSLEIL